MIADVDLNELAMAAEGDGIFIRVPKFVGKELRRGSSTTTTTTYQGMGGAGGARASDSISGGDAAGEGTEEESVGRSC